MSDDPQNDDSQDLTFGRHDRELDQSKSTEAFGEQSLDDTHDLAGRQSSSHHDPSQFIGDRYRLIRCLGEGGMGSVWEAEQLKPIKRKVALKLIKQTFASPELLTRFELERQALALMDHPYIATIHDGGTTEDGQPFFAMELVKGEVLNEFCDRHQLDLRQRLDLFRDVCSAVQHAHQKGIVHRDLKPTNIVVTLVDGKPVPKVIDFGLAKVVQATQMNSGQAAATEAGQILGTLRYMSPEQAALTNADIDTRTDVYALGVILYELITGTTPLDSDTIKGMDFFDVLRRIREDEPESLSKRLRSFPDDSQPLLGMDTSRLRRSIDGDIDCIVSKAIALHRDERYDSVRELSDDIRLHLENEPILARPPTRVYRIRKFLRKHQFLAISASIIFVVLIAGIIGTSIGLFRALDAEEFANQQKLAADEEAEYAKQQEGKAVAAEKNTQRERDNAIAVAAHSNFQLAIGRTNDGRISEAITLLDSIPEMHRNIEWYLQRNLIESSEFTFDVSEVNAHTFDWNADGESLLATGKRTIVVPLYEQKTEFEDLFKKGERDQLGLQNLAYSYGTKRSDHNQRLNVIPSARNVVSFDSSKRIRKLEDAKGYTRNRVNKIATSDERAEVVVLYYGGTIGIWNPVENNHVLLESQECEFSSRIAVSRDGKYVAVSRAASQDISSQFIRVYDVDSKRPVIDLRNVGIGSMQFSPDGRFLLVAQERLRLVDFRTGDVVLESKPLGKHYRAFIAVFSPDGSRIATTCGTVGKVLVLNAVNFDTELTLTGNRGGVAELAFDPTGARLATLSSDRILRVFRLDDTAHNTIAQGKLLYQLAQPKLADSKVILHDGFKSREISSTGLADESADFDLEAGAIRSLAVSSDGLLAQGFATGISLVDSDKNKPSMVLDDIKHPISIAFSHDDKFLAAASLRKLAIWKLDELELIHEESNPHEINSWIEFRPESYELFLARNTRLDKFEIAGSTVEQFKNVLENEKGFQQFSFSVSGNKLLAKSGNDMLVFESFPKQEHFKFRVDDGASSFAWTRDQSRIVIGGNNGMLSVADATSGELLIHITAHKNSINSVAVDEENHLIVTASSDNKVRMWHTFLVDAGRRQTDVYRSRFDKEIMRWHHIQYYLALSNGNRVGAAVNAQVIKTLAKKTGADIHRFVELDEALKRLLQTDLEKPAINGSLTVIPVQIDGIAIDAKRYGTTFTSNTPNSVHLEMAWGAFARGEVKRADSLLGIVEIPYRSLPRYLALMSLVKGKIGEKEDSLAFRNRLETSLAKPRFRYNRLLQDLLPYVDKELGTVVSEAGDREKPAVVKDSQSESGKRVALNPMPSKTPSMPEKKTTLDKPKTPENPMPASKADSKSVANKNLENEVVQKELAELSKNHDSLEKAFQAREYDKVIETALTALGKSSARHPSLDLIRMKIRNRAGFCFRSKRELEKAEEQFELAFELAKSHLPETDELRMQIENNLAATYWSQRKLKKSLPLFENNLKNKIKVYGRDEYSTQLTMANLGVNLLDSGKTKEAIPYLEEASHSDRVIDFEWVFQALLRAHLVEGDYEKASKVIERNTKYVRATRTNDQKALASLLARNGSDFYRCKEFEEAESLLRESIKISENLQPKSTGKLMANVELGKVLLASQKYEEGEITLVNVYNEVTARADELRQAFRNIILKRTVKLLVDFYSAKKRDADYKKWREIEKNLD